MLGKLRWCLLMLSLLCGGLLHALEREALPAGVFASVAGEFITAEQFHVSYAEQMRQRFYHGKIPDAEAAAFDQEVLQSLVDRVLLRQEALRRKLVVDEVKLEQALAEWRLVQGGAFNVERERLHAQALRDKALAESLQAQVEASVAEPSEIELRAYYDANLDKFTRPEQLSISLVLLKVAPYELAPVWQSAYDKAQGLLERLLKGEAFAVLAKEFSQHESAANGGGLGFVHAGMLSSEVQDVVNKLAVGEVVSAPVVLLQGVALLRVDERLAPQVVAYEQAKVRVGALLLKDERERAWLDLLAGIRVNNPVVLAGQ